MEKMKAGIEAEGGPFTLFGGEPLLVPLKDLEELWAWGYKRWRQNSVQTNGLLITDQHVELFRKYNVHVGISIDGPGPLNDLRVMGTLERTRAATARVEAAIDRLCREKMPPSLIITLHRLNATTERLPRMHDWLRNLEAIGVTSVRLHILEVEDFEIRRRYALSEEENIAAFMHFAQIENEFSTLRMDVFADIRNQLIGCDDQTTCIWNACDPYTTRAVRGVEGQGQRSNCGRTNKDGIDFEKSDTAGYERYLALYYTPQTNGGCRGCRFFLMCKGQCPGTAIDGDWRNRTEYCSVWKHLYTEYENQLIQMGHHPISDNMLMRLWLEHALLEAWKAGQNPSLASLIRQFNSKKQGGESLYKFTMTHGDSPHGDSFRRT
jgi:uncharacterized protein